MTQLNAPIALFVYNRPEHTQKTLDALKKNKEAIHSDLFVFSDGPKTDKDIPNVLKVRKIINAAKGFSSIKIIEHANNYGLASSVINGVSKLIQERGKVIVLEDDLITSPFFLTYMNTGLNFYSEDDSIGSLTGFSYPVKYQYKNRSILLPFTSSWGWATWERAWKLFENDSEKLKAQLLATDKFASFSKVGGCDFGKMLDQHINGKNDSWFIRWNASLFLSEKLTVWPSSSLVSNFGIDGSGVHCSNWFFNPFQFDVANVPNVDFYKPPINMFSTMRKIRFFFYKIKFLRLLNAVIRMIPNKF